MNLLILVLFIAGTILCGIEVIRTRGESPGWWGATIIGLALVLGRVL